jgi:hypothetical protein
MLSTLFTYEYKVTYEIQHSININFSEYFCINTGLLRGGLTFTINGWLGHLNLRIVSRKL